MVREKNGEINFVMISPFVRIEQKIYECCGRRFFLKVRYFSFGQRSVDKLRLQTLLWEKNRNIIRYKTISMSRGTNNENRPPNRSCNLFSRGNFSAILNETQQVVQSFERYTVVLYCFAAVCVVGENSNDLARRQRTRFNCRRIRNVNTKYLQLLIRTRV